MKIKDSRVLVTGANRGIGRAFVEVLLERGAARIYAAARQPTQVADLFDGHAAVTPVRLDVTDAAGVAAVATEVKEVDLLINNAGTLASYGLLDAGRGDIERDFAVNFFGVLEVTKALLPALERSRGAVLNVLSLVSMASMAGIGGYAASKAAAWSLTQALRAELASRSVQVFAPYPGAVDTDMIRAFEMTKTPPRAVAERTLAAVEDGELDCFPDPMSTDAGGKWLDDPRSLERMFAAM